jgi:hypothetical protein
MGVSRGVMNTRSVTIGSCTSEFYEILTWCDEERENEE